MKAALRGITHNRIYSSINILGLTVGLTACMIVATVVKAARSLSSRKERFRLTDTDPNGLDISILDADTAVWQMLLQSAT